MEAEILRINCLAALSKCQHLRQLDLTLATQSIALPRLLHSIGRLACLELLSIRCEDTTAERLSDVAWPPRLNILEVSGTLTDEALGYFHLVPRSLTSFTIYDAPKIDPKPLKALIEVLGHELESLHIGNRTLVQEPQSVSDWLLCLPKLRRLHVREPQFYFGYHLEIPDHSSPIYDVQNPHPLEHLELDGRGFISSDDLEMGEYYDSFFEVVAEGYLGRLRRVTFYLSVALRFTRHDEQIVHELDDLLRALAREDGERATIKEEHAGARIVRL